MFDVKQPVKLLRVSLSAVESVREEFEAQSMQRRGVEKSVKRCCEKRAEQICEQMRAETCVQLLLELG